MKELTTKDKESLVAPLEKHYTIKEKKFIDAIASNKEEKLNFTLKAYAIGAEQMNTPKDVPTNTSVVVINRLYAKLQFVKAIKDVKNIGLKEAKDLADQILIYREGAFGECYSSPFIIGDSMNSKFTKVQWEEICGYLNHEMAWEYVPEHL